MTMSLPPGPIAQRLSTTFDDYWNSDLSIPVETISGGKSSPAALNEYRESLDDQRQQMRENGIAYVNRVATGEPYNGIISGRLPLIWAHAQVVCDSPDKKKVENGTVAGRLIRRAITKAALGCGPNADGHALPDTGERRNAVVQ